MHELLCVCSTSDDFFNYFCAPLISFSNFMIVVFSHTLLSKSRKVQPSLFRPPFMRSTFFHPLLMGTHQIQSLLSNWLITLSTQVQMGSTIAWSLSFLAIACFVWSNIAITKVFHWIKLERFVNTFWLVWITCIVNLV